MASEQPPAALADNSAPPSNRRRRRGGLKHSRNASSQANITDVANNGSGPEAQPQPPAPPQSSMAATALAAASAALDGQSALSDGMKRRRKRGGGGSGRNRSNGTLDVNDPSTMSDPPTVSTATQRQTNTTLASAPAPKPPNPSSPPAAAKNAQSNLRFADIPSLSDATLEALSQDFQYEYATPVQASTIAPALAGRDLLARAKTGTGKTLGFGLPTIERIARNPDAKRWPTCIRAVVVSPTRELASQIATELGRVCAFHGRHMGVQLVVGGTNRSAEEKRMKRGPNTILVCTPGRFHDHCENSAGFLDLLRTTEVAVLDECDRLLEMGFRAEIVKLLRTLPDTTARQTLLYSATMPTDLNSITSLALKRDHDYINCVAASDAETACNARQLAAVVPKEEWLPRLAEVISEATTVEGYKIMVFCQTARSAGFLAQFFRVAGLPGVLEIHSRMSQSARTRESAAFRSSRGGAVIFTSDVSARGVDYPDTTLIIQLGAASDRDTYIHRLGRTARAGTAGEGLLLLTHDEAPFLVQTLKGLPIEQKKLGPLPQAGDVQWADAVSATLAAVPRDVELKKRAEQCYGAWLGFMNGMKIMRWSKPQLVAEANLFARQIGLTEQPRLEKRTVGKMGLKGVPGLLYTSGGG